MNLAEVAEYLSTDVRGIFARAARFDGGIHYPTRDYQNWLADNRVLPSYCREYVAYKLRIRERESP